MTEENHGLSPVSPVFPPMFLSQDATMPNLPGSPTGQPDNPPPANHIALPVGFALHEYTIEAMLGAGGFGITFRARDNNLHAEVAIKEYLPNHLAVRAADQSVLPRSDADNALAARLGEASSSYLSHPVESNQVFIRPGPHALAKLRAAGGEFYDWGAAQSGEARLVVSWNQSEADIDAMAGLLSSLR